MKITVLNLEWDIRCSEALALFGRPIERTDEISLLKSGLHDAQIRATGCLGWIWRKWLASAPPQEIAAQVEPFIDRGLELRERCRCYDWLPQHDLLLLMCALFSSTESQLKRVAEKVADASGDKGEKPVNNGELYAAAWCGTMKHWILGNQEKATEQSNLIWGAYRDQIICAAPKPLVAPWLKRDWKAFIKAQQKDFEKWWHRARKSNRVIRSETEHEIVVTTSEFSIESGWCWAHCGMAMAAFRQGAEVATDPFWFPPHALKCVPA